MKNIITISGKPGCGKSTMAKILAKKMNCKILSSGEKFRELAKKQNMNITDFVSNYLPLHDEIDIDVDNYFVNHIKNNDNLIVPTRVVGHLLNKQEIGVFKVYLYANEYFRVKRIAKREKQPNKLIVKTDTRKREIAEYNKYNKIYNIDINDLSVYNLVIYTHFLPENIGFIKVIFNNSVQYIKADNTLPETISGIIIEKYKEFKNLNFK